METSPGSLCAAAQGARSWMIIGEAQESSTAPSPAEPTE